MLDMYGGYRTESLIGQTDSLAFRPDTPQVKLANALGGVSLVKLKKLKDGDQLIKIATALKKAGRALAGSPPPATSTPAMKNFLNALTVAKNMETNDYSRATFRTLLEKARALQGFYSVNLVGIVSIDLTYVNDIGLKLAGERLQAAVKKVDSGRNFAILKKRLAEVRGYDTRFPSELIDRLVYMVEAYVDELEG